MRARDANGRRWAFENPNQFSSDSSQANQLGPSNPSTVGQRPGERAGGRSTSAYARMAGSPTHEKAIGTLRNEKSGLEGGGKQRFSDEELDALSVRVTCSIGDWRFGPDGLEVRARRARGRVHAMPGVTGAASRTHSCACLCS